MTGVTLKDWPPFVRELSGTLPVHAQFVLYGNIRDRFLIYPYGDAEDSQPVLEPLINTIWEALKPDGYSCVIVFDPVRGPLVYPRTGPDKDAARRAAEKILPDLGTDANASRVPGTSPAETRGAEPNPITGRLPLDALARRLGVVAGPYDGPGAPRAAFVIDYAARIAQNPGQLSEAERGFFRYCEHLSHTTEPREGPPGCRPGLYNPVIWLVENERALPAWLTAGNERIRTIGVPLPDLENRTRAAEAQARAMFDTTFVPGTGPGDADPDGKGTAKAVKALADETEGMTLHAIQEICRLVKDRGMPFGEVSDAVRLYKLGIENSPWRRGHIRGRIEEGEALIPEMVRGQREAVTKTLDILKRAALGLSGAQASSSASRPRGVLFLAGPTGVGKTELAKAVAKVLFGESSTPLRFDMSEFSAEQAADRLIGAPPGYVGHEAGGELTGAVRRNPFQVVLFDEIEKAHPRILDKFLQILDDGRLTDGQGVTTYFSETVLIFTSNLGIMVPDPEARGQDPYSKKKKAIVSEDEPYEVVESKVRSAVAAHFVEELGRPELLNRFGENIVVFRFIDADTANEIFERQLGNIVRRVREELQVTVTLTDAVRDDLRRSCTADRNNGGRGIGMALEAQFINPLSRELFRRRELPPGSGLTVTALHRDGARVSLELR